MNALDQIEAVLLNGGVRFQRKDDQLGFAIMGCGLTTAWFRIFQNGRLLILVGEFGFGVLPNKRAQVCEFCNLVNHYVLSFANLELDPENGNVQVRHALLWPDGNFGEAEVRWFLGSSAKIIADLSGPLADLVFGSEDMASALEKVKEMFRLANVGSAAECRERASA